MKTERVNLSGDLIMDSSIDAMIVVGISGIVSIWNNAASQMFNRQPGEAIGNSLFDVLPSFNADADLQKAIEWAKERKKSFLPSSSEFAHRNRVETHVIPLQKNDVVVGIMLLIHDVSHRILKEKELQKLNFELQNHIRQLHLTSGELSQLANIASHSIRDPIRDIYTSVEGLLRLEAGVMSNTGKATFRRIQSSLNRMNLLLDDIITLTGINIVDKPRQTIHIAEIIKDLKIKFAKRLTDTNTKFTTDELCDIVAHRKQVTLLLQHIISNIIRTQNESSPSINISCIETGFIEAGGNVNQSGNYYLLSIKHNSQVFDKAAPTSSLQLPECGDVRSYNGPVIAIIIVAKIMEAHSGFFEIEKQ